MTKQENKLSPLNRALALPEDNPAHLIERASEVNTEVHDLLGIEEFLNSLNGTLFDGKGEITPIRKASEIIPEIPDSTTQDSSRFKRYFSLDYKVGRVMGGSRLYVKKEDLTEGSKSSEDLNGLGVCLFQDFDLRDQQYSIFVIGELYFGAKRRYYGGQPAYLEVMRSGRFVLLPFGLTPSREEIVTNLGSSTMEVLQELVEQGYIAIPQRENWQSDNPRETSEAVDE